MRFQFDAILRVIPSRRGARTRREHACVVGCGPHGDAANGHMDCNRLSMSNSPYAAEDAGAFHFDSRSRLGNAWPCYANLLLATWLFVSAFAWPHSRDACAAAWISGAMIGMNAFAAIWASPVRFFNVILGGLSLAWQAAAATHEPAARMNGIVVSALVIALSLVPPREPAGL
jgi:hypothetical protein